MAQVNLLKSGVIIFPSFNSKWWDYRFFPHQIPVVLLVGMPGHAAKEAGGEEESEFVDGRIHDQI